MNQYYPEPTFHAYRSDRQLANHISRAFLKSIELDKASWEKGIVELGDSSTWYLILDPVDRQEIMKEVMNYGSCYCIGSFQLWKDGRTLVVLRKDKVAI